MTRSIRQYMAIFLSLLGLGLSAATLAGAKSSDGVWQLATAQELQAKKARSAEPWVQPGKFAGAELAEAALQSILIQAPMEFTEQAKKSPVILSLPTPGGEFERFEVVESPMMEPALAQTMAERGWPMKTYSGTSLDRPATTVRFDWGGPAGFHAAVRSPGASYYIDPYYKNDRRFYASYLRSDYQLQDKRLGDAAQPATCGVTTEVWPTLPSGLIGKGGGTTTGGNLRTYRLANAASAEYTAFFGGQTQAQAAIVTSINRINQLWAIDLSVRLVLVGNNINLVYTDAGTDPYVNSCTGAELNSNNANITAVIGDANFDIGHVFVTGGGGLAGGLPCQNGAKATGCTGTSNPVGDPFDIDFVAHEMGHQFSAGHTWNGATAGCSADNFDAQSAYEPGSGTTVLSYAGICGADNVQTRADAYYHRRSLDSMLSTMSNFSTCFTSTAVNPNAPTVSAPPSATIPMGTPFELTAINGNDADSGDAANLTYVWEQFDLGTQAALGAGAVPIDDGVQPLFRTFPPSTSPTRSFPSPTAGAVSVGETLPSSNRTMNFKVTVRDNRAGGGREGSATTQVTSTTAAGPFRLTAPNGGENLNGLQTVTWNVASTTAAPVNAANVSILLSTDGGLTFPTTLIASTPNDGSEQVTLPDVSTTTARIKVKAVGNIFFDVSDADFLIGASSNCLSPGSALMDPGSITSDLVISSNKTIADLNLSLRVNHTWVGDLVVSLEHVGSGSAVTLIDRPGVPALSAQGCSRDNIDAILDDEATSPVENQCSNSVPTISGRFTPNNPLSAFDGQSLGGTWRLAIRDDFGGDTGSLVSWCLTATSPVVSSRIFLNGFE